MAVPRRRLLRAPPSPVPNDQARSRRLQRLRARLERERSALVRWQKRLRRAFKATETHQFRIARIERQLAQTEE